MTRLSLRDLLIGEMREVHYAEKQLLRIYPKLANAAVAEAVQRVCREGMELTAECVQRLEAAFDLLQVPVRPQANEIVRLFSDAAQEVAARKCSAEVKDAAILALIRKLAHHGHACYGNICGFADALQETDVSNLLGQCLAEKEEVILEVAGVAEQIVNPKAAADPQQGSAAAAESSLPRAELS
ncbi:MAG TPA: DUF892 family protein [Ferrovibrio sp.]|uniref:YciE/YciF ferroxidase family protein n=1 Tax=Ferrovibrio sp. TaxID=1917215 RepID=UPI002ED631B8